MIPHKTPAESEASILACHDAWRKAQDAIGLERLKLVHQAFPHAVQGASRCQLLIAWSAQHQLYSVADHGGFITLVTSREIELALSIESMGEGKFRETVTGTPSKPRPAPQVFSMDYQPAKSRRPKKTTGLTLSDLGL